MKQEKVRKQQKIRTDKGLRRKPYKHGFSIERVCLNGEVEAVYPDITTAVEKSQDIGATYGGIYNCVCGSRKIHARRRWRKVERP